MRDPVTLVLTHAHNDHRGGAPEFDVRLAHRLEQEVLSARVHGRTRPGDWPAENLRAAKASGYTFPPYMLDRSPHARIRPGGLLARAGTGDGVRRRGRSPHDREPGVHGPSPPGPHARRDRPSSRRQRESSSAETCSTTAHWSTACRNRMPQTSRRRSPGSATCPSTGCMAGTGRASPTTGRSNWPTATSHARRVPRNDHESHHRRRACRPDRGAARRARPAGAGRHRSVRRPSRLSARRPALLRPLVLRRGGDRGALRVTGRPGRAHDHRGLGRRACAGRGIRRRHAPHPEHGCRPGRARTRARRRERAGGDRRATGTSRRPCT